ncbi:MAG: nucleoside phosphorylase [Bacteroidota bacterium]
MQHFPPSELILHPDGSIYHLHLQPHQIADTIILVGDPGRVPTVSKYFDTLDIKVRNREFITHTGTLNGKKLSVVSTGIGSDNIDIVLTELDALVNIDFRSRTPKENLTALKLIRIGTSGSLQKDIAVDSFLISQFGIGLDGLMHFYDVRNSADEHIAFLHFMENVGKVLHFPIRPYIASAGKELLYKMGYDFRKGITLTCPGFYGPQARLLRLPHAVDNWIDDLSKFQYDKLHCTNFEMETAAIYGMANALGHQAISFNAILANRVTRTFSKNPQRTIQELIELVLERVIDL